MESTESLIDLIREREPLTVAAFMDLALYHPAFGYYARAAQRSGRAGDFFTSVDVGPLFGELLEIQLAEMYEVLRFTAENAEDAESTGIGSALSAVSAVRRQPSVDLVEVGAGNGRLSADILRAARLRDPALYNSIQLRLVEASESARRAQRETLGDVSARLASAGASLPESFEGVLIANELLDAFPVHQVVMRDDGLREVYVVASRQSPVVSHERPATMTLTTAERAPSTPDLQAYLDRLGVTLEQGWRAEINLRAVEWIRDAARRLRRGFLIVIDYGHPARELYSVTHASGTLTTFSGHRSAGPETPPDTPAWLNRPGEQDLTAHVDFTSVRAAAEAEGLTTLGFLDQTYFLLGLLPSIRVPQSALRNLNTLVQPGGLGSTHKVLILGRNVGKPALKGCSFSMRVT